MAPGAGNDVSDPALLERERIGEAPSIGGKLKPGHPVVPRLRLVPDHLLDRGIVQPAPDDRPLRGLPTSAHVDPLNAGLGIAPDIGCDPLPQVAKTSAVPTDDVGTPRINVAKDDAGSVVGDERLRIGTTLKQDAVFAKIALGVEAHEKDARVGDRIPVRRGSLEPGESGGCTGERTDRVGALGRRPRFGRCCGSVDRSLRYCRFLGTQREHLYPCLEHVVSLIAPTVDDQWLARGNFTDGLQHERRPHPASLLGDVEVIYHPNPVDPVIHGAARIFEPIREVEANPIATGREIWDPVAMVAVNDGAIDYLRRGTGGLRRVVPPTEGERGAAFDVFSRRSPISGLTRFPDRLPSRVDPQWNPRGQCAGNRQERQRDEKKAAPRTHSYTTDDARGLSIRSVLGRARGLVYGRSPTSSSRFLHAGLGITSSCPPGSSTTN